MKNVSELLKIITEFIATNPNSEKLQNLINFITLYLSGKTEELAELIKVKFFLSTQLIDEGIIIIPYAGPEKTNVELLSVLVKKAKAKQFIMSYNKDVTGYDSDIENWGFLEEPVTKTSPKMYIPLLPKGGMTEGEMVNQAKNAKLEHEHLLCDSIRIAISLIDADFYKEKGTFTNFFLKNKRKRDNISCKFGVGFDQDGEFYINVYEFSPGYRSNYLCTGFPLSKKKLSK